MSPKAEILSRMRKNFDEFKAYKVKKLGLFGSFAAARQTSGSDIDILVEFERGGKTFDNYMGLKFFLEERLGRSVDLVIIDGIKPALREEILKEVKYAA